MAKKVIVYVSDIVLGSTGDVIHRESQREAIERHASENGYEIVSVFEDDVYAEDVLSRPGIQQLLACEKQYDCLLVERIWALSRQWTQLAPFLNEMNRRGHKVESARCLWDCVSQRARWYFHKGSVAFSSAQAMSSAPASPQFTAHPEAPQITEPPPVPVVTEPEPAPEAQPAAEAQPAPEVQPVAPEAPEVPAPCPEPRRKKVKQPAHLFFSNLCHRPSHA